MKPSEHGGRNSAAKRQRIRRVLSRSSHPTWYQPRSPSVGNWIVRHALTDGRRRRLAAASTDARIRFMPMYVRPRCDEADLSADRSDGADLPGVM